MKTSQKGIGLIKEFEDFSRKAYPDPGTKAAPYTIGYGTTRYPSGMPVRPTDVCTKDQAENYLRHDLEEFERVISDAVKVPINQNQFDALVSFTYNVGAGSLRSSTLLRMLNKGWYTSAAAEFSKWNKAAGKVLPGLTKRREAERKLFLGEL